MKKIINLFRARIESSSNRSESIQHGTSAQVETIRCRSYRDEILKTNESLTIPFDVRLIELIDSLFLFDLVSSFYEKYTRKLFIKTER